MLTCPYDNEIFKQFSGLSAHVRLMHKDQWRGTLSTSLPEGRDIASLGTPEDAPDRPPKPPIAVAGKGHKKEPYPQACPWCSYQSIHPPGLSRHIESNHPKKWKGNLGVTLLVAKKAPSHTREAQNKYKRDWYAKNKAATKGVKADAVDQFTKAEKQRQYNTNYRKRKQRERKAATLQQRERLQQRAELAAKPAQSNGAEEPARAHVNYCPHCGGNLQVVTIAMGMLQGSKA